MKDAYNNKSAKNSDVAFGVFALVLALVITPVAFIILGFNSGVITFESGFAVSRLFDLVGGIARTVVGGIAFAVLWIVIAVRSFMRVELSNRYTRIFKKAAPAYPRLKFSAVLEKTKKPLKTVSTELNTLKKRGYFGAVELDLINKEIVFDPTRAPSPYDDINEAATMYKQRPGVPVLPAAACLITLVCLWQWQPAAYIAAAAALILVMYRFPVPVYFIETAKPEKYMKPAATGNKEADGVLTSIYENEKELIRLCGDISSPKITVPAKELLRVLGQIKEYIAEHPDQTRRLRQFGDYYLPTAAEFLRTYESLEKKPDKGENIRATLAKIEEAAADMVTAFKREYDSLFSDKNLDISAEVAVMKTIIEENKI